MTALAYGEQRPPIRTAAESLYVVLDLDRAFGLIPIDADVRVYVVNDEALMIALGGLSDRFLLGEHIDYAGQSQLDPRYYTGPALRLRREIEDAVRADLPRRGDGRPWFGFMVWLQPQVWAAKYAHHVHGVTALNAEDLT